MSIVNMQKLVEDIEKYESDGMTSKEEIVFFQGLVDNGIIWTLQGHYGRVAVALIKEGLIMVPDSEEV
tara:strand:+ start:228 stop:431 length:204 start_codon:yes stop_codon:yes gene_type:complete